MRKLTPRPGTKIHYESSGVFVHENRFQIKICMYPRLFETLKKTKRDSMQCPIFPGFSVGLHKFRIRFQYLVIYGPGTLVM